MNYYLSTERVSEALAKAEQHWRQDHPDRAPGDAKRDAFTIAFSRQAGTYGAEIAREVGNRLGWPVYDSELTQRIADDLGIRRSLLECVDERQPGWLEESLATFSAAPAVSEAKYFRHLMETLLALAKIGSCVIVGRGGVCALPLATTLRVRVVAPLAHRIAAVQHEHGTSPKDAAARVEATDRDRNRFVTNHFPMDPTDPANYDLLLNAARFSVAEAADLVIAALERIRRKALPSPGSTAQPALAAR
ncbi:MAG: cytidylate kinase-like family protein [Planctomycetota bacterium]